MDFTGVRLGGGASRVDRGERAKEEGRGGSSRERERGEGRTEGGRGRWCVGKTKTITHCLYIPGVKSWNMTVSSSTK